MDDVPANLTSLEVILAGLGCSVHAASSGDQALRLLLRERFAVMLLDVQMPGMDGYEVARHARMHSATRELPIIFLTAHCQDNAESLRLGYDCGAVDFLFKPLNRDVLRSKVRIFAQLYTSRRELADANLRLEAANAKLLALADEEAVAVKALRQANDELTLAYRDAQSARRNLDS